jgi:hypothetical protein
MGCGLLWLGWAAQKRKHMLATRTYQITADDLDRLHLAMGEQARMRHDTCVDCKADLCDDCQKNADLLQQLADAISMHRAGVDIILSTQLQTVEKEKKEEGTVQ